MPLPKAVTQALARLTGERAASPSPDDPAFQALCLNLSHVLRQPITSPRVRQAATVSWRFRHRSCDLALSAVWPADIFERFQARAPLLVMPPAGCLFCPTCLGDGITGYLLSPDPNASPRDFCGSAARIWLEPVETAYAAGRPIWVGWSAAPPAGHHGHLVETFSPDVSTPLDAVITATLLRCEEALRALPGQCLADRPFWTAPYQPG